MGQVAQVAVAAPDALVRSPLPTPARYNSLERAAPRAPNGDGELVPRDAMSQRSTTSEAELVARARAGDREAFEQLVREHADRLHAVILRFVADPGEAEEVTQEAFLRAWRSIGRFQGRSRFFTWLYRIGINEAKRRAGRRPPDGVVRSIEERPIEDAPDWSEAPELRAEQSEVRATLERAVRALPPKYRAPLVLRDIEGLSTAEAAEAVGLREAAFKSRLHRARLAVRRALDEHFVEGAER